MFDRMAGIELSTADLAKKWKTQRGQIWSSDSRFPQRLTEDPQTYTAHAQSLVEEFVSKVDAQSDPWTRRFATKFAVIFAAGYIAAEMKIAPWSRKHVFSVWLVFIGVRAKPWQPRRRHWPTCSTG